MEIIKFTPQCVGKVDVSPQSFPVVGKFFPTFSQGKWGYNETVFPQPAGTKTNHSLGQESLELYAKGGNRALFLAQGGDAYLGHIAAEKDFMGWAYVEALEVAARYRGGGTGTALIRQAIRWAKDRDLAGLRLETQDNNLMACRFYLKQGFQVGGVDYLRYHTLPAPKNQEAAVFFYLLF